MNPKLPDLYVSSSPRLSVALCQVHTETWDLPGNLERTIDTLSAAADQGAHLAVTPECVLHGYGEGENQADTLARLDYAAVSLDGPEVAQLCDLADRRSIAIVVGMAIKTPKGLYHNAALVIDAQGEIVDVYHKVHCRTFEHIDHEGGFTSGNRFVCVDVPYDDQVARVGVMICFDREMPESVRCLRAMGAELVVCPMAWYTESLDDAPDYAQNEMITRVRAAENEVFIAVVNHAGRFNGGSFAVGPGGEGLLQLGETPEARIIEIPVLALREQVHSEAFGWMGWGYRRPDVYKRHM